MSSLTSKPGPWPWFLAVHLLGDVCYNGVRPDVVSYSAFVLGMGENPGHLHGPAKEGFLTCGGDSLTWCSIVCNITQFKFRTNLETSLYARRAGQSDLAVANTKSNLVECSTPSTSPRFAFA